MDNKSNNKFNCWFSKIKHEIKRLKMETGALYFAYKRPDVPLHAKLVAILVVGYALSPIDLIPDFIPVLGYLDDLILIPLGIALAVKLIPSGIMDECRQQAENVFNENTPKSWIAGGIIVCIWVLVLSYFLLKII